MLWFLDPKHGKIWDLNSRQYFYTAGLKAEEADKLHRNSSWSHHSSLDHCLIHHAQKWWDLKSYSCALIGRCSKMRGKKKKGSDGGRVSTGNVFHIGNRCFHFEISVFCVRKRSHAASPDFTNSPKVVILKKWKRRRRKKTLLIIDFTSRCCCCFDLFSVDEHVGRCPAVTTCWILHDGGNAMLSRRHEFGLRLRWKVTAV